MYKNIHVGIEIINECYVSITIELTVIYLLPVTSTIVQCYYYTSAGTDSLVGTCGSLGADFVC